MAQLILAFGGQWLGMPGHGPINSLHRPLEDGGWRCLGMAQLVLAFDGLWLAMLGHGPPALAVGGL